MKIKPVKGRSMLKMSTVNALSSICAVLSYLRLLFIQTIYEVPFFYTDTEEIPKQINPTGFKKVLESSRFLCKTRFGCRDKLR